MEVRITYVTISPRLWVSPMPNRLTLWWFLQILHINNSNNSYLREMKTCMVRFIRAANLRLKSSN
jgi:hypothetical protein